MKKNLVKIALLGLVTAALVAVPTLSRAQDSTNTPAAIAPKKNGLPFHGKLAAVDPTAMTVTVGTLTINVTATTKITKDGKKATLADFVVGDTVGGSYHKDSDGKLTAATIHDGIKPKKKKAADSAN
jgi:hypothetical protein